MADLLAVVCHRSELRVRLGLHRQMLAKTNAFDAFYPDLMRFRASMVLGDSLTLAGDDSLLLLQTWSR
jgi:hypothetical protein